MTLKVSIKDVEIKADQTKRHAFFSSKLNESHRLDRRTNLKYRIKNNNDPIRTVLYPPTRIERADIIINPYTKSKTKASFERGIAISITSYSTFIP